MYISTLFSVVSLLALASASPIAGGSSSPCVSPDGWSADWMASGKQNGIVFCGDASSEGSNQSATSSSLPESTSNARSTTSKPASSSQASSITPSSTGLISSNSTSPKKGHRKPCRRPNLGKMFQSSPGGIRKPGGAGNSTGGGSGGFGAGLGIQLQDTSSDGQSGGTIPLSSDTTTSESTPSTSASTVSTSASISTSIPASTGDSADIGESTLDPAGAQTAQSTSATTDTSTGAAGDGKTYQATITRYTDNCAGQVGACGFLGTATSFQCAMSEFWTAPGMPGQCGTCWRITNGTMANSDGTMATTKTNDITVMTTNTCAYYSGDPTGSCSQSKDAPRDRWGSDTGLDLCHDTGAPKAFWGEAQDATGGIAVATIQQVDCDSHWLGDLSPESFVDWTKYQPDGTKNLKFKPGHR